MSELNSEQALVSGELWHQFCDTLKRAGDQVLRPEAPADAATRAEGFRYLTRLLRIGLEMHVEFADPDHPVFFRTSHETAKIGADNPDNLYQYARLRGDRDYRIRGQRNTVHYLSFRTQKGGYEGDGTLPETGFLDTNNLVVEDDGSFEIIVSQQRHPGNWLPMEPDSNAVLVRHTFHDRRAEVAAEVTIKPLAADVAHVPPEPEEIAQGLLRAANFAEGTARLFADWAQSYLGAPNELPPADQALCQSVGGDPNIFYYHGYWQLEEDEALLIEVERIPECETWNIQIDNYWMESLDYRYHRICINKHNAHYNSDGSVTLVLAHRDPAQPNWLETEGGEQGTLCFRWVGSKEQVHPKVRKVSLAELGGN
ncbi:MAG: DUF1214 domain-containing protein [Halioglobus sp.]|nr:DUF1214 domain-containing protein [Halioglobus sp.]